MIPIAPRGSKTLVNFFKCSPPLQSAYAECILLRLVCTTRRPVSWSHSEELVTWGHRQRHSSVSTRQSSLLAVCLLSTPGFLEFLVTSSLDNAMSEPKQEVITEAISNATCTVIFKPHHSLLDHRTDSCAGYAGFGQEYHA